MSKFLRIDTTEMQYLWRVSFKREIVFGSPNDVLRSVLLLDSKHSDDTKKEKKNTRIDDEVLEELQSKAKQLNMPDVQPLDKLVKKILELQDKEKEKDVKSLPAKRPATR